MIARHAVPAAVALVLLTGCAGAIAGPPPSPPATPAAPSIAPTAREPVSTATGAPMPSAPRPSSTPRPSGSRGAASAEPLSRKQADRLLLEAAAAGDIAEVRRALAANARLETRNEREQTALVVATKAKHTRVALALLAAGADPDAKDEISDSAFLYAGAEGLDDILRATIRHGADVSSTNRFGGTALIPASEHGHVDTVRLLINAGVPLDHVNRLGWTALLEAVVLGNGSDAHVDVVRQLLAAGADPSIEDKEGRSPRQLASARGQARIVALIDDAAQLRMRSRDLIRAARSGDEERVEGLLAAGASVAVRDDSGATALVAAAYGNHLRVARRLLAAGADPNAKDETVQSAYLIATSEVGDDPRLLRLTLDHGADVRSLDSWRGTGLIRAADRGFHRIVETLLRTDIAIDHVNRIGYTALHEAVVLGDGGAAHVRTVAALVRAGVDTSVEDARGATALESARALGYREIVALLD